MLRRRPMGEHRTAWHYYRGLLLQEKSLSKFEVRSEEPVTRALQHVDWLIIRRLAGENPQTPGETLVELWSMLPAVIRSARCAHAMNMTSGGCTVLQEVRPRVQCRRRGDAGGGCWMVVGRWIAFYGRRCQDTRLLLVVVSQDRSPHLRDQHADREDAYPHGTINEPSTLRPIHSRRP